MDIGIRERLVNAIRHSQDPDGGFASLSSSDPVHFLSSSQVYRTSFVAAHVLIALASSRVEGAEDIKEKIAGFLLRQISETGAVNYWARDSVEAKTKPYPDDLDDTACAIAGLALYDKKILDGELLGKVVAALLACEVQPGGPYRTWLISADANPVWRDIDPTVNAHLAFALGSIEIDLPGLDDYLSGVLKDQKLQSPYYPDELSVLSALSRRPQGRESAIIERVLALRSGSTWGNPVADALALGILLRLGDASGSWESEIEQLARAEQNPAPYAFCIDPSQKGVKHFCGSSALTAALILEALSLVRVDTFSQPSYSRADEIHERIVEQAHVFTHGLAPEFSKAARAAIQSAIQKDTKRQITLTPFMAADLLGERGEKVSERVIESLGLASLYGWLSYTLLDDVMDADRDASVLPLASTFLRKMQSVFDDVLPENVLFHRWVMRMMNRVDASNAWELSCCRFQVKDGQIFLPETVPSFREDWMLFGRSIGHAIGPVGILCSLGESPEGFACQEMLTRYCDLILVKQMHDDAHDWESDLMRGQINSAGARVLERWYELHPDKRGSQVVIDDIREEWRTIFWMEILPAYSREIVQRCDRVIALLGSSENLMTPNLLVHAFERVSLGAKEALAGREEMLKFLKTLGG
jgi:hypothetical protein